MQAQQQPILVDESKIGLDRAKITKSAQIQLPKSHSTQHRGASVHVEPDSPSSSSHNVVDSIKQKKHRAGSKIRKSLHIGRASDDLDLAVTAIAGDNGEPSESRYVTDPPEPDKATMKDFIHDPIDTIKAKLSENSNKQFAAQITAKEVPHSDEVDLIRASEAVDAAQSETQRLLAIEDLSKLMQERQATYVRWTFDRHITKVRVLPRDRIKLKPRTNFEKYNSQEGLVIDWKAYFQHVSRPNQPYLLSVT